MMPSHLSLHYFSLSFFGALGQIDSSSMDNDRSTIGGKWIRALVTHINYNVFFTLNKTLQILNVMFKRKRMFSNAKSDQRTCNMSLICGM